MIRFLTKEEVLDLHRWSLQAFGGMDGIIDAGMLDSALANPQISFGGIEAYPNVIEKAVALAYSLVMNHAFADGNKRVGFWAMSTFLRLNDYELICDQQEGAAVFLEVAAGERSQEKLLEWVASHSKPQVTN